MSRISINYEYKMKDVLPAQFKAMELFTKVNQEFGRFETIPTAVDFDFSQLRFVRPSGVVFLSNLALFSSSK